MGEHKLTMCTCSMWLCLKPQQLDHLCTLMINYCELTFIRVCKGLVVLVLSLLHCPSDYQLQWLHNCLCSVTDSCSFYSMCGYGHSHQKEPMELKQEVQLDKHYIPNSNCYMLVLQKVLNSF